jgi:DNA-directed RNA polymerase III subunit RPC3
MTTHHIRLAFDLLGDLFPDGTSKEVASYLNRKGPLPFASIVRDLNIPAVNVARSLAILAIHDIVECHGDVRADAKRVLYAFNLKRTLYILHYSKCIHCARQLYGFDGELIIEELLLNGKQRMSTLLVKVYERLIKAGKDPQVHSLQSIKESFRSLVSAQFLQRIKINESKSNMSTVVEGTLTNLEQIPELTQEGWKYLVSNQQEESMESSRVKAKSTVPIFGDENIFWKVNFQRFFAYLRDQELIQAFTNRIDQNAGEIVRTILRLAEIKPMSERTIPISFIDIAKTLTTTGLQLNEESLQKYINVITSDVNNCVTKIGDQGRGTFIIDFQKALSALTKAHIQSFLRERYGSNALRIYNMLEERGCLSQKQIEDMAMINAKEAQQHVYSMFIDGMLTLEELSKATDFNPTRTFYFFRVNLYNGVLSLLDHSYKTMSNLMQRHQFERERHRKLIDKRDKVEAIIHSLREQNVDEEQIKEVDDILSPIEKEQIQKLDAAFRKIDLAQLQLTETILLLEVYLSISNSAIPVQKKTGGKAAAEKLLETMTSR